jgi:uncharacterized protein YndB with AHSA1/START domain
VTKETMTATTTINVPVQTVFDVLADPTTHQAIDGTGWVGESQGGQPLTHTGQIFRVAMHHEGHPDKDYEVASRVEVFEPPRAIAWLPGHAPGRPTSAGAEDAALEYGGWIWRYDLEPVGDDQTNVTLTYDWSAVPPEGREIIPFPMFEVTHLENSLKHLAEVASTR